MYYGKKSQMFQINFSVGLYLIVKLMNGEDIFIPSLLSDAADTSSMACVNNACRD